MISRACDALAAEGHGAGSGARRVNDTARDTLAGLLSMTSCAAAAAGPT